MFLPAKSNGFVASSRAVAGLSHGCHGEGWQNARAAVVSVYVCPRCYSSADSSSSSGVVVVVVVVMFGGIVVEESA